MILVMASKPQRAGVSMNLLRRRRVYTQQPRGQLPGGKGKYDKSEVKNDMILPRDYCQRQTCSSSLKAAFFKLLNYSYIKTNVFIHLLIHSNEY